MEEDEEGLCGSLCPSLTTRWKSIRAFDEKLMHCNFRQDPNWTMNDPKMEITSLLRRKATMLKQIFAHACGIDKRAGAYIYANHLLQLVKSPTNLQNLSDDWKIRALVAEKRYSLSIPRPQIKSFTLDPSKHRHPGVHQVGNDPERTHFRGLTRSAFHT
jgi:hypothetical protein